MLLGALLLSLGGPARAEDDADTEVAKRLFRQGSELYNRGEYQKALEAFDEAKVAKPLPAFDFNVARCHDRLGHWAEALAAYERFAATTTDQEAAKEAQARIPMLRERMKIKASHAVAEEHYRNATTRFNGEEYKLAIDEFELAYKAVPDPLDRYNIAQAYRLMNDGVHAIENYRLFLKGAPGTPLRATVEKQIDAIEIKLGIKKGTASETATATATIKPTANPSVSTAPVTLVEGKPAPSAPATTSERLKPIAELIKTNRAGFRACFDAWSKTHPGIGGKVMLSFYLDPDGVINQADAEPKGFDAPEVGDCIVAHARSLLYPPAPNGKYTRFNYPFDFKAN